MAPFVINFTRGQWLHTQASGQASIRGRILQGDEIVDPARFAKKLNEADRSKALDQFFGSLNGFYAWTAMSEGVLRAGVDHVRSIPLFYGLAGGKLFLGDDAEWVRSQVGDKEMDPLAREEFLLAGYVTGQETLYPNVKQLQAGEYLEVNLAGEVVQLKMQRYYRFWHTEPVAYDESALRDELKEVTFNAIRRLVSYAAGRQIVIPLSGGYDSRLIAVMLKRMNYSNIICFTYGLPGNKEAEYSRRVAEALGLKWTFVEYSVALWKEQWVGSDANYYKKMSANHASLPHVQDWLAIKMLLLSGEIEKDSIVVPGHSGDFVAGSHIPLFVFDKSRHPEGDLFQSIINYHLSNCPKDGFFLADDNCMVRRVRSRMDSNFNGGSVDFANLYEYWDWQERQAKYIVNSVRVYDNFELDWWLPLWDIEFIRYWQGVPLKLRKGRAWYKEWISEEYVKDALGDSRGVVLNNAGDRGFMMIVLMGFAKKLPRPLLGLLRKKWNRRGLEGHFLAFDGLVENKLMNKYIDRGFNIIGMYSDQYLSGKW